ncbi:MAG: hypothetical protein K8R34_04720 [Methanosarcinales archaeon]|nr:hypothetical protein [Methanosarcinales archaeon]MCD4797902.1 hypothetical protein [Methanosarcinales archaeon]MCD4809212.1 hypothetical protein [Methanosarcinales archaeon]
MGHDIFEQPHIVLPHPFFAILPPLSPSLHLGARPDMLRPLLWCGGWQTLFGASLIHGYPAVWGCGVDVLFVRCRQQLKYITREIY